MKTTTNAERLSVLETKVDTLLEQVEKIDHKLEIMNNNFVTFSKHQDDLKDLRGSIGRNQAKIDSINKQIWIQNTLSAVFGAVLSLLVAYFITNLGG